MSRLANAIIQPSIFALGSTIFLYSYNNKLRYADYFLHIPFWICVIRPTGFYWNQKFLKQMNKGIFPPQMKTYKELYLTSKNSILYDIIFNHTIYHSLVGVSLLGYMYLINKLINGTQIDQRQETIMQNSHENSSFVDVLQKSALTLIKGRILISSISILSEYWISYFSIQKNNSTLTIPTNIKRILLLKQMILNCSWFGLILGEFYKNNWIHNNLQNNQDSKKEDIL